MAIFTLIQSRKSADLFLIPNANGCNTDLTPIGKVNNWNCVNDPIDAPDEDSTYNYSKAVALKYDLYSLPNHTTEIGAINYVQVFARAKSHEFAQHEDGIFKIILTDDECSNIYKSNDINLKTNTYQTYNNAWEINPRTTVAWTWDDVDNLQIGVECSSPTLLNQTTDEILYPNGDGGQCGSKRPENSCGLPSTQNWETQIYPNDCRVRIYDPAFNIETWYCDHYLMDNYSVLGTEPINYVYVKIWVKALYASEYKVKTLLVTGGNDYYGEEFEAGDTWTCASTKYVSNPDTLTSWTWADINAVMCGFGMYISDTHWVLECIRTELHVNYNIDVNPEIRTTQCYAKVNYTPSDTGCQLNKPEHISVNHSMNIKMLNFWNGTREVYSLNRSGKSMVITGSEYQSNTCDSEYPCERIACIREMGKDGSTITISGLRSLFNGDFKIRSFGWKHINKKPEKYDWILELEYDD